MGSGEIADAERGTGIVIGMKTAFGFVLALVVLATSPCRGADFTAEQVRRILAAVAPGELADLSGKPLENLDLSNLDFKRADLSGANLKGANLEQATLIGAIGLHNKIFMTTRKRL